MIKLISCFDNLLFFLPPNLVFNFIPFQFKVVSLWHESGWMAELWDQPSYQIWYQYLPQGTYGTYGVHPFLWQILDLACSSLTFDLVLTPCSGCTVNFHSLCHDTENSIGSHKIIDSSVGSAMISFTFFGSNTVVSKLQKYYNLLYCSKFDPCTPHTYILRHTYMLRRTCSSYSVQFCPF